MKDVSGVTVRSARVGGRKLDVYVGIPVPEKKNSKSVVVSLADHA